ncbi:arylamine N-acetyltransferase [Streptomyces sp. NPDC052496]|uniref:arylamine N-acetyltransferase family protein n=1 Tax=Streptomyces sp. NPDC052496 TaxID=3154951 RepID=UPI003421B20B
MDSQQHRSASRPGPQAPPTPAAPQAPQANGEASATRPSEGERLRVEPLDRARTDAYLRRIGATRPAAPDAEALRELHLRHLRAVPFENLSVHLAEDVVLEYKSLVNKVVGASRGGFCYELNGAFAALLRALGYRVDLLAARVHGPDGLGIPYDHLALRAHTGDGQGGPWLADIGFGRNSQYPLRLDSRDEQPDPAGVFRIEETADGDLDVLRDGVPQYRLEQRPRALADFVAGSWYHRTSPDSPFTRSLVCSRLTETGRVTLSGRTLVITGADDSREERELTEAEVLPAYRTHFGITLDRIPELRG